MGNFGLIDLDTPADAYTKKSLRDGTEWTLVFSDEFEEDGRSFYPGEDPYWEAVDLHYWVSTSSSSLNKKLKVSSRVPITWNGMILQVLRRQMALCKLPFPRNKLTASITKEVCQLIAISWVMFNVDKVSYKPGTNFASREVILRVLFVFRV